MPGNEVGDRVHNFFVQENLSQGQYHSQVIDGNSSALSNFWAGSLRPNSAPIISNFKNFNLQQSDSEQGHTSSPHLRHGLNPLQSNLRRDTGRHQLQNQQTAVNGYMLGHQVFQTRQNEASILGVDTESGWHSLSRGMPLLESQGSGLELYKKNLARNAAAESPVNFDLFGGQQQINGRHSGMLQPLHRQQSGMNEMHLLQQQAMFNQILELQRQQHSHQLEPKQLSSMTPPSMGKQTATTHSASLSNGIPINEASYLTWQPEVVHTNTNWLQRAASPAMQGSSNGVMLSPEQGQALRLMGVAPNQGDPSLYGIPISGSRGPPSLYPDVQADKPAVSQVSIPQQYSHVRGDKPAVPQILASGNSFPTHQYTEFSDQCSEDDGTAFSRQDIQRKSMFDSTSLGMRGGLHMENFQQVNPEPRIVPVQDFHGRQELSGSSEMSQDRMVVHGSPLQNVATLDPAEEKILFGSDDSLWDRFGRNTGGFSMLDGPDGFSGFPSVQSGSWSALMQSAVAETSSTEMAIQEEWNGLSFQNMEQSSGNEQPLTNDSGKRQSGWTDNNFQSTPNVNSRPYARQDDVSRPKMTESYSGFSEFHHSGPDTSHEQLDRLQTDTQRAVPQFLERGKWLDCSPQHKLVDRSNIYGSAANSSGLEKKEKVVSDSSTHQQTISSCNSGDQFNKSNGWDAMESAPPDSSTFKTPENENTLLPNSEDVGRVPAIWESGSNTNLSVGLPQLNSAGNMLICGEDSGMNGITALQNSGAASMQSSQRLPNVDKDLAGTLKRNEGPGKYRHQIEKKHLVSESLKNGNVDSELCDTENSNQNKNSMDGLGFNPSHPKAGGMRDGTDIRSPKLSGQGNRRPPANLKFQYHPMGDMDVEAEPYGNKHVVNSEPHQPLGGLKGHDQSHLGPLKYGCADGIYAKKEMVDSKSLDDNTSKITLPVPMLKNLIPVDGDVGNYALDKTTSPRLPVTESSDGSVVHPQWNQISSSQGSGLQLAPPTQRLPVVMSHGLSKTSCTTTHVSDKGDNGHTWLATNQAFSLCESSHGELRNNISPTTGPSFDKASQYSVMGNIPQAATHFPFSRTNNNQNMTNLGGQRSSTQSANATFLDHAVSMNRINESCERAQSSHSELESAQDMSMQILAAEVGTQPSDSYNAQNPSKVIHNVWTSVSSKHHGNASKFPSQSQLIDNCEMEMGSQRPGDEVSEQIGQFSPNSNTLKRNFLKESSGQQTYPENVNAAGRAAAIAHLKESVVKSMTDASQSSPATNSQDIEAFGRSLRPNNFSNQKISLLKQVQSMTNVEFDPRDRDVKRFKVLDGVVGTRRVDPNCAQELSYGYNNTCKDVSRNNFSGPPSDPDMLRSSAKDGHETNAYSKEVVGYHQKNAGNTSDSCRAAPVRSDHALINPQMAPSWFEKYGTFKNGKILPMYDVQKMTTKVMDYPFIVQNQSDSVQLQNSVEQVGGLSDAQLDNAGKSTISSSNASEHVPSQLSILTEAEPDFLIMREKKRKSATSELLPWHKELTQASARLRSISAAEVDWAQPSNRLIEKVEDDAGVVIDLPVMVKSKRRLVLTTQLIQQLLSPPPAVVLFEDGKLHHESVLYSIARLALGDACSSISWSGCDALLHPENKNLLPKKLKSSDKFDQCILKVLDLVGRARKLENDIVRLDSGASILDLRMECQDLERFSVMNRFAKFHGRPQNDGVETLSSSQAGANTQKSFSQKYVTAVPLPRNLPDRVQCLSL